MRDPARALDVDLAIAARGRAALRERIDEAVDGIEDPLLQQFATLALLLGDR